MNQNNERTSRALKKIREISDKNSLVINSDYDRITCDFPSYYITIHTKSMSKEQILEVISLCRQHDFSFNLHE